MAEPRFEWMHRTKAECAIELLRRNLKRQSPTLSDRTLQAACMFCECAVDEGDEYLRTGENSQRLTHYDPCLWEQIPSEAAATLKELFESGKLKKHHLDIDLTPPRKATAKKKTKRTSARQEKPSEPRREVAPVQEAIEKLEVEVITDADYNYRMGKLEGRVEELGRSNVELRAENTKLKDELMAVYRQLAATSFRDIPEILKHMKSGNGKGSHILETIS